MKIEYGTSVGVGSVASMMVTAVIPKAIALYVTERVLSGLVIKTISCIRSIVTYEHTL
jgi:hypothetical protein